MEKEVERIGELELNKIYCCDCLEGLKKLPDNSVSAIVTDPPYGLSFMGKKWDYDVPSIEIWKECLRVLKHGGHLLSFAGTRTYHRMAVRIEDGGFEIRDMISWIYGSGFPKSLNIGKAIDKIQGNEREVIGFSKNEKDFRDVGKKVKEQIGIDKLSFGTIENAERKDLELTKGNSKWEGWGTALKPACEPIVVARKPLSEKNVALNVLKWGTGGINIDECRIETNPEVDDMLRETTRGQRQTETWEEGSGFKNEKNNLTGVRPEGRFPANIILDEEAGKMLDEQSGVGNSIKSARGGATNGNGKNIDYGKFNNLKGYECGFNDKGGASRFFYCAKASKSERNKGCEELEEKEGIRTNAPRENEDIKTPTRKNNHPTVKPIKLMEYLIKLVTPKDGIVLDPFMGSGTTAVACKQLGRKFIGFEISPEYCEIANKRLSQEVLNF